MRKTVMSALYLASLLGVGGFPPDPNFGGSEPKEPKNKFGLSDEEKEKLKTMSPKEKKKFLKERSHAIK